MKESELIGCRHWKKVGRHVMKNKQPITSGFSERHFLYDVVYQELNAIQHVDEQNDLVYWASTVIITSAEVWAHIFS